MNAGSGRVVIKIGGSILTDESAYAAAAKELRGFLNAGPGLERLYVVVSAMKGSTERAIDRLAPGPEAGDRLRRLLSGTAAPDPENEQWNRPRFALFLLWGEIEAAYVLADALADAGIRAKTVTQLGPYPIVAEGAALRAELDLAASRRAFAAFDRLCRSERVIVLAGFGAVNGRGEPVLLGRNASDYVAAILSALDRRVGMAVFLKDVGGIYADFRTRAQRLIPAIDIARLRAEAPAQVLDPRVLDIIACDFRVAGSPEGKDGTLVRQARTA